MSAFSPIGTDVRIGAADYCVRGGFAFPGRCAVADPAEPSSSSSSVPFGTFGLPVSPELVDALESGPSVGPSITPDPVPDVPNPETPIASPSLTDWLLKYPKEFGQWLLPESFPFRASIGLLIPGGLLLLLALWAFKKMRR